MKFLVESGSFWADRINVTRRNTLPAIYEQMKATGRWDAMRLTWKHGDGNTPHIFWDSDIAKTVESCCYALEGMNSDDPLAKKFYEWIDDAIGMIEKAQGKDGYINIYYTVVEPEKRWTDLAHQHELYCAGHLLEAAVAHYKLTGETRFLDIMIRYVNYIRQVFGPGPGQKRGYPGHEEIELALVRLYEVKPEQEYLDLLKYFVEYRGLDYGNYYKEEAISNGKDPMKYIEGEGKWPNPPQYWYMQAHKPIREQDEILGHSVRAMYFLAGVQGYANIVNDGSLKQAVNKLWRNMVDKKLYIHGGIGAIPAWEGFGEEYELPLECYSETCASIGILFLGKRMLEESTEIEVARVMSRALYNNVLGGASLDGKSFYYDQPLIGNGHKRSAWFECSCCPPNYTRLMNSLQDYAVTETQSLLLINLYIGGEYETYLGKLWIRTDYPNKGTLSVTVETHTTFDLAVANPGKYKCTPEPDHREDYIYFKNISGTFSFELTFDITPRIVKPDPKVSSTKGKLAIERGPFVYGLEQSDSPLPLSDVQLPPDQTFNETAIQFENTTVVALLANINGLQFKFVPYFVIGNRVPGDKFIIWIDST
jgi:DUF1680 family protein